MRILHKIATPLRRSVHCFQRIMPSRVHFLNRDHVVSAVLVKRKLILTTTLGCRIEIRGSTRNLGIIVEELVGSAGSNFVQISQHSEF